MRFSNGSCSATNDSVSLKAKQNHNHQRASSHTLRAACPVLLIQLCCCLAPCSSSRKPEHQRKSMKANSTLSHLALSHSRLLSALRQPPPHPARKKFCICIHTLACPRPPRLCASVRMVWVTENKGQHGGANKCAQDGYLRPIDCDRGFLSCSLGAPPSELLHFLRVCSADLETKK